jgi:hypothetical protein
MLEPQPYTAWSASSITITANAGGIPAGTATLYVLTGANTIVQQQTVTIA